MHTDASGSSFFLADGTNSTLALTDANGNLFSQYTYDTFGSTTQSGTSTNTFQFSGRENDGTGLYYMRARYYSPALQRFISQDPIGFAGGINLYAYAAGNPVSLIDPLGLDPGGGGGEGGVPPNSGTQPGNANQKPDFWSCTFTGKVGMSWASTTLDAVGIIPGGGNVLHGIQFGAAIIGAGVSVFGSITDVGLSATGVGLALTDKGGASIAIPETEMIPVVGNIVSTGATLHDIFGGEGLIANYEGCMAGTHP